MWASIVGEDLYDQDFNTATGLRGYGARGKPGLFVYDRSEGNYTGDLQDPDNPVNVTRNGITYRRLGYDLSAIPGGPDMGIVNKYRGQSVYDPEYGWLAPEQAAIDMIEAQQGRHSDNFFGKGGPWEAFSKTIGPMLGASSLATMAGYGAAGAEGFSGGFGSDSLFGSVAGDTLEGGMTLADVGNPSVWADIYRDVASGAMTPATNGLASATDAIQGLAALNEAGGGMGATAGAKALGFPSVEAALSSVSPSFLSDGFSLSSLLKSPGAIKTLLGAGTSLIGAGVSSNAAKEAARIQAASAGDANALVGAMYNQNRADLQPWREAGGISLAKLSQMLGIAGDPSSPEYGSLMRNFSAADLNADPIYGAARDFQLGETRRALTNAASARGETDSGVLLQDLLKYGTGVLTGTGQDAYNRFMGNRTTTANLLSGVAGTGQTTGVQLANLGQTTAAQQAQNITSAGAATAAGQVGSANALTSSLNNIAQQYATQDLLERFLPNLRRSAAWAE